MIALFFLSSTTFLPVTLLLLPCLSREPSIPLPPACLPMLTTCLFAHRGRCGGGRHVCLPACLFYCLPVACHVLGFLSGLCLFACLLQRPACLLLSICRSCLPCLCLWGKGVWEVVHFLLSHTSSMGVWGRSSLLLPSLFSSRDIFQFCLTACFLL